MNSLKFENSLIVWLFRLTFVVLFSIAWYPVKKCEVKILPKQGALRTTEIQSVIDSCYSRGGGIICFQPGEFISGGLFLRPGVNIHFCDGAQLISSPLISDFIHDAILYGENLTGLRITGKGIIDGVNCNNPKGEEGFRGPHGIKLKNCNNFLIQDITIKKAGNYAVFCRNCKSGNIRKITIYGGHDGIHTRFCSNFKVTDCDIRTGDDAFAGNDNSNYRIENCQINSSCNGFRLGCYNLLVKNVRIWGPGEFKHISQGRNNMLAAFVHFSPLDENPVLTSGKWKIKNVRVENAEHVYVYNIKNGLWQTGQPVGSVSFSKVNATGILSAFQIYGDMGLNFKLLVKDSEFHGRIDNPKVPAYFEGCSLQPGYFFKAQIFHTIILNNVLIEAPFQDTLINVDAGKLLIMKDIHFKSESLNHPYSFNNTTKVRVKDIHVTNNLPQKDPNL